MSIRDLDPAVAQQLLNPSSCDSITIITHPEASLEHLPATLKALLSHFNPQQLYLNIQNLPGSTLALAALAQKTVLNGIVDDPNLPPHHVVEDPERKLSDKERKELNRALADIPLRTHTLADWETHLHILSKQKVTPELIYILSDEEVGLTTQGKDPEGEITPTAEHNIVTFKFHQAMEDRLRAYLQTTGQKHLRVILPAALGTMVSEHNQTIRLTYRINQVDFLLHPEDQTTTDQEN